MDIPESQKTSLMLPSVFYQLEGYQREPFSFHVQIHFQIRISGISQQPYKGLQASFKNNNTLKQH